MRWDNRNRKFVMRYSATYPMGVMCRKKWGSDGVRSVGVGVRVFRGEGEQWNWRFKVRGLDRINGIYRIG
jgi:hypothetical protein